MAEAETGSTIGCRDCEEIVWPSAPEENVGGLNVGILRRKGKDEPALVDVAAERTTRIAYLTCRNGHTNRYEVPV